MIVCSPQVTSGSRPLSKTSWALQMLVPIQSFGEAPKRFKKSLSKIPAAMQQQLAKAFDELLAGEAPPGRRLEKLEGFADVYSVRLNDKYRFAFKVYDEGLAMPVAVGPHDEVYAGFREPSPHLTEPRFLPTGTDQSPQLLHPKPRLLATVSTVGDRATDHAGAYSRAPEPTPITLMPFIAAGTTRTPPDRYATAPYSDPRHDLATRARSRSVVSHIGSLETQDHPTLTPCRSGHRDEGKREGAGCVRRV